MKKTTIMCSASKLGNQPRKEITILESVCLLKRTFRLRNLTLVAMALGSHLSRPGMIPIEQKNYTFSIVPPTIG